MSLNDREPGAKVAHIEACLRHDVEYKKSSGFDRYDFINQACSDVSLNDISLTTEFLSKKLGAPLMIAPMTGGVERGRALNKSWAHAAEHFQIAMGVGSQRLGIEDISKTSLYEIRKYAPTTFIFANLGAAQLCKGWGIKEALKAVEMIRADAIFIHLNAMQEACQGGDVDFGLLNQRLAEVCSGLRKLNIPVFAREVSFGISKQAAQRLVDAGVSGIDCAGSGGTSWAKVESFCAKDLQDRKLGQCFGEWGIPTVDSIINVRSISKTIPLIATGGLRSGLDLAKAISLGADLGAMARPMLLAACQSEAALFEFIETVLLQLRVSMFGAGISSIDELKKSPAALCATNLMPSR